MRFNTLASAALLGLSSAALAQVATTNDPKLGNGAVSNEASANSAGSANTSSPADNVADPGKR